MWYDQEKAAIRAVKSGHPIVTRYVRWLMDDGFLRCELPSGRWLSYPAPEIQKKHTPWGDLRDVLTYETTNQYTRQWQREQTYGGKLVENVVQAIARDIMAEAMLRIHEGGVYSPVLSVHDELISEAPLGVGSVQEFERLMAECPLWAVGCPVAAEGWTGERYRK